MVIFNAIYQKLTFRRIDTEDKYVFITGCDTGNYHVLFIEDKYVFITGYDTGNYHLLFIDIHTDFQNAHVLLVDILIVISMFF
jgi:hypothetical protein